MEEAQIRITVLSGVSKGDVFRYTLKPNTPLVLGRDPSCDVVLQDLTVSRRHVSITRIGNDLKLEDLGSSRGTVHMGFAVAPGAENAGTLSDGDEFKIGDSLFRVNFDPLIPDAPKQEKSIKKSSSSGFLSKLTKLQKIGIAAVTIVLLLLLFLPSGGNQLPAQRSEQVLNMPQERVLGFLKDGESERARDQTHLDKVQFFLPAADVLVEYEYKGQVTVDIRIEDSFIGSIEPYTIGWQRRELLVRDFMDGVERKLVFDNTDYPKAEGANPELKKWGIRNVRVFPLTRTYDTSFVDSVKGARSQIVSLDKSPASLFVSIRAAQEAIITGLQATSFEAIEFAVDRASPYVSSSEVIDLLDAMTTELEEDDSVETVSRHLTALVGVLEKLEAELWRRVDSRMLAAKQAAKVKSDILAYDQLMAAMAMIPEKSDYRYIFAERMLENDEIVPKKVREKPEKYRKRRAREMGMR